MDSKNYSDISLGIVTPMAGEEDTAERFIKEVFDYCKGFKEIRYFIVVDRATGKPTENVLSDIAAHDSRVEVIAAYDNRHVVDAYMRGYQAAIMHECDWILEIDGGYSHLPSEIPQFFENMERGYDAVFGSRFCEKGQFEKFSVLRYWVSYGGTILVNSLLKTNLKDMTSGFELFTRSALEYVLEKGIHSQAHFFQTEIKYHLRNHRVCELPIHYRTNKNSISGLIILDSFKNLFRLYRERNS